jgi:tetratricopeptide (TPR) repeat protein
LYDLPRSGEPVVGRRNLGMLKHPCLALLLSSAPVLAQAPDPELLQRYSEAGQRALAEHRYVEAEQAYEKLRELSPETAEVHAGLGLIYYQQRKFTAAVPALRQAIKLNANLPRTDILLALCLSELGQYKEALPGLGKAFMQTADDPLRRLAGLQLQRAYTHLEQDAKAAEVALALTRLYPKDPEVLYHSGRLLSNYAYLMTMKLARVAPESAWTHQAAGEANESQGLYEAAVREYREVLALDPRRPGIHFRIGRTLLALAQPSGEEGPASASRAEAMREFTQELALDPTSASAAYELGEAHRRSGDLDQARRFFEAAVDHYPDFEEAQLALGRVLLAAGEPKPALAHLRKAIALDPENAVSYYQLSRAHQALGNAAGQKEALAKFQALRAREEKRTESALLPLQVTKQELESKDGPP